MQIDRISLGGISAVGACGDVTLLRLGSVLTPLGPSEDGKVHPPEGSIEVDVHVSSSHVGRGKKAERSQVKPGLIVNPLFGFQTGLADRM